MSKNNYFENDNIDAERLKRQKARKRKKTAKCFLTVLGLIVVAVAVFLITVKICVPDFDFKTLIPDNISQMINADSKKSTTPDTTAQPATAQPTTQKPESELLTYLPAEDFAFKTSVQGNHLGNLLNGGKIGTDMTYVYHISNGDGIYRFEQTAKHTPKAFQPMTAYHRLIFEASIFIMSMTTTIAFINCQRAHQRPKSLPKM